MARLGFIGLGTMGSAIARRLVDAGHTVTVWNRSEEAIEALVAAGATRASSPAEALAAPVSFSMLANDEAAEALLTADNLRGTENRIHVNMASISAAAADRLERIHLDAGLRYVASPVLGRPTVAAAGALNILVAGPEEAIGAVEPFLEVLSTRIWRFGDRPRRANVVKIAVNFTIIHAMQALGEAISLVEAHEIDASDFVELLGGTLFGGVVFTGYGSIIAERRYSPPGFTMALGLKDLGLAEEVAAEGGVTLPSAPLLRDRFETALATESLAGLDWSAMAEVTRGH
ncbi:NAD(P)-dependent oxidoreductase [Lacisediminihabitans profunda]|uniref:NAD(P)-dependent oxidoreductase n=1 Tax=Lacisediminihabitans profunda TaxID=2594790 RepID=A0A5C8UN97_9MICO|nr:NAD(P)-dependent oxidoreductase [Lacisediminihabitans profunda]TXN29381.1 NAD(P)-dependent oxidoreductase [Lacisediminihabitans profunda]